MSARENDFRPGDTIRGNGAEYLVTAILGSGGMGAVYLVRDKNIGRMFVLKVLHRSLAHRQDLKDRFEHEARALGHLSHPGIIEIFQLNRTRDAMEMPYYLMEVLTGETLADSLRRHGRLDLFTAVGVATQMLYALDHAHERGVVHRDIKPDNVFLHRDASSQPVVKVLDFGILKLVASAEDPGMFIGTPRYAAPEQLRGDPSIGPKADLYAAGVVLYQMLTGHHPFEGYGGSLEDMVHTLGTDPPLLTKHGAFPPELVALVTSALAKHPDRRPADGFTFASQLAKIRSNFAPDRQDPHTHVTAEVVAEARRARREASLITSAHLAAPTTPDPNMGMLMDALQAGGASPIAAHDVVITGFEPTAEDPARVLADRARDRTVTSPGAPAVRREAVTAPPRSDLGARAPGSVRYVTKEAPRPKSTTHQTIPMARAGGVVHLTSPMPDRPGRFARPPALDAGTPEPQAIDNESGSHGARDEDGWFQRWAAAVRVWPVAVVVGLVTIACGVVVLRAKRVDATTPTAPSDVSTAVAAPKNASTGAAPLAVSTPVVLPPLPSATVDRSSAPVTSEEAGVRSVASASGHLPSATPARAPAATVDRSAAASSSRVALPAKDTSMKATFE